jgi:outer membrane protein TolC
MKSRFYFYSCLILFSSLKLNGSEVISWQSSLNEASLGNTELQAAKNSFQSSVYQMKGARSGFYPKVSASAGYGYDSAINPKYYSATITATENLFSGFSDSSKLQQAKFAQSASEVNLEIVKSKVSFDLKNAFMGLIYSQKFIKLAEDIEKRREANLKLVQLRFESGRENIGALELSKAYLAQSKYDLFTALNSLEIYQAQLAKVLGRDNFDSIEVEGFVPVLEPFFDYHKKIDYKNIAQTLPDYKKAYFNEKSALVAIDLSNSAFYPSFDLTQSAARIKRESTLTNNNWAIEAAITFPLYNGGKDFYASKTASEEYRASVLLRKSSVEIGVTKLKQAYSSYLEAVMKLQVDKAFVLAQKTRERIAKTQYNNGLITFTDWDIIENDLILRQKSLLQTERDRVVAEAAWEQVQGLGVIP